MMVDICNPGIQETEAPGQEDWEFEECQGYIVCSSSAWATQLDPVSKTKQKSPKYH
jgi:hypothetical protein